MSKNEQKKTFFDTRFFVGMLIGSGITAFVGFLPSMYFWLRYGV